MNADFISQPIVAGSVKAVIHLRQGLTLTRAGNNGANTCVSLARLLDFTKDTNKQ
jgi:hypothetical protein